MALKKLDFGADRREDTKIPLIQQPDRWADRSRPQTKTITKYL
jgi:hypothetical protein